MSAPAFTPGQWVLEKCLGQFDQDCGWDVLQKVESGYRGSVCHVTDAEHIDGITVAERDANARLIVSVHDLVAAVEEALEFAEDQADVVDGSYGEQQPNKAMQLAQVLRDALLKAGVA